MKVVECYRDLEGDICYLYKGAMYAFFGKNPLEWRALDVVTNTDMYIGYFPSKTDRLLHVFVTKFEFEEENQNMNEVKTIGQKVMEEGWKIAYIRPDRSVSTGHAVFTVLTRQLPKSESGLETQYEVKYSICNPKDSFCRREGIRVAYGREATVICSSRELLMMDWINSLDYSKLTYHAKGTLSWYCWEVALRELENLALLAEKENSSIN